MTNSLINFITNGDPKALEEFDKEKKQKKSKSKGKKDTADTKKYPGLNKQDTLDARLDKEMQSKIKAKKKKSKEDEKKGGIS